MSSSLILTNFLFCSLAALLLFPLLRQPNVLTFKKGFPIFIIIILVLIKLLVPYEFTFTHTLPSKNILPMFMKIFNFPIYKSITFGYLFLYIWLSITLLLLIHILLNYRKLKRILSLVPETKDTELTAILTDLCIQKNIRNIPQIIELGFITSPFIIGYQKPIIVLPKQIRKKDARFILMHELEHLIHHHLLMKIIIETVAIFYWWNPVIWILRRELIRAFELQADANVIKDLSKEASLTYLETLINISRNVSKIQNSNLSLSFTLKSSMVEYRIRTILASNLFQKRKMNILLYLSLISLSSMLLLFSFIYTFESYAIHPTDAANTFTINPQNDFFILKNKQYDLYIDGTYVLSFDTIPGDLSDLPVYN